MRTFQRMQRRGKTIILITHDPEVAAWADRTVHIRDGRLFSDDEERRYLSELAARKQRGEKDAGEKNAQAAAGGRAAELASAGASGAGASFFSPAGASTREPSFFSPAGASSPRPAGPSARRARLLGVPAL